MSTASRKTRAIAAGGAVIGLGVAMTLAAWTDSEFARGQFSTANFGIQGAAGDNQFGDHATEGEALALQFNANTNLQPGQTVFQAYQLKNIDGGVDSTVTFANEKKTGELGNSLTAEIVDAASCDANTTGAVINQGNTFDLIGQTAKNLCIKVKVADSYDGQNQTGDIVWEFTAEPKQ